MSDLLRCVACGDLFCRCTGGPTANVVSCSALPSVTVTMKMKVTGLDLDAWLEAEGIAWRAGDTE